MQIISPELLARGFFCSGPDLPGLVNRIIVRYASPGPDLQPPQKRIIVRFISSWTQCPDLQRSCNRSIVRFTPSCPAYPGIVWPSGRGCSEQLFGICLVIPSTSITWSTWREGQTSFASVNEQLFELITTGLAGHKKNEQLFGVRVGLGPVGANVRVGIQSDLKPSIQKSEQSSKMADNFKKINIF